MSYFVYAIVTDDKPSERKGYIGITKSTNKRYNAINVMYKRCQEYDSSKYTKLRESFETRERRSHQYKKLSDRMQLEDAEKLAYEQMKKLGSRCLNDDVFDPVRVECEKCGMRIKERYMDVHLEKYCVESAPDDLFGFVESA